MTSQSVAPPGRVRGLRVLVSAASMRGATAEIAQAIGQALRRRTGTTLNRMWRCAMAKIEGEILIDQPVEAVFDFVADQRNELHYNPRMVSAAKITDGPVGKGTVFRSATKSMGRTAGMRIELTGYDRPGRLTSHTIMRQADMDGTLTFEPAPSGTRMRWSWLVRPKGAVRLLAPLITWMGRRQEQTIWTSMKRYLENTAAES